MRATADPLRKGRPSDLVATHYENIRALVALRLRSPRHAIDDVVHDVVVRLLHDLRVGTRAGVPFRVSPRTGRCGRPSTGLRAHGDAAGRVVATPSTSSRGRWDATVSRPHTRGIVGRASMSSGSYDGLPRASARCPPAVARRPRTGRHRRAAGVRSRLSSTPRCRAPGRTSARSGCHDRVRSRDAAGRGVRRRAGARRATRCARVPRSRRRRRRSGRRPARRVVLGSAPPPPARPLWP